VPPAGSAGVLCVQSAQVSAPQGATISRTSVDSASVQYYMQCSGNKVFAQGGSEKPALIVVCSLVDSQPSYALGQTTGTAISELSIPGCTDPTTSMAGCDKAVTDTSVDFIGKVGNAQTPAATNCPDNMNHYDTCKANCATGEASRGVITCFNGTMLGKSVCGEEGVAIALEQYAVRGTLTMTTVSHLDLKEVQAALADYLGQEITTDDVLVVLKDVEDQAGKKVSHINYEVRVDDGAQANSIAEKMEGLNVDGSAQVSAFTSSANKNNINLETGLTSSAAPIQTQVFALGDAIVNPTVPANTDPVTPAPTVAPTVAPVPAPAPAPEEESSNTAAIVGGVLGGLVGLGLIAGGGYFFMNRKQMAEA